MNSRQALVNWFKDNFELQLKPDPFVNVIISAEEPKGKRADTDYPIAYFGSAQFRRATFETSTNEIPYTCSIFVHVVFTKRPKMSLLDRSAEIGDKVSVFVRNVITKSTRVTVTDSEGNIIGSVMVHDARDLSSESINAGIGKKETQLYTIEIDFTETTLGG